MGASTLHGPPTLVSVNTDRPSRALIRGPPNYRAPSTGPGAPLTIANQTSGHRLPPLTIGGTWKTKLPGIAFAGCFARLIAPERFLVRFRASAIGNSGVSPPPRGSISIPIITPSVMRSLLPVSNRPQNADAIYFRAGALGYGVAVRDFIADPHKITLQTRFNSAFCFS